MGEKIFLVIISALVGGIIGGGAIAGLAFRALRESLRGTFATIVDVNNIGSRVNGLETVSIGARDRADEAHGRLDTLEAVMHQQWERIGEKVVEPLDKISTRMEQLAKSQATLATDLALLTQRVELTKPKSSNRRPRS